MRHFSSYGPVDRRFHFCVERRALVECCVAQLARPLPKRCGWFPRGYCQGKRQKPKGKRQTFRMPDPDFCPLPLVFAFCPDCSDVQSTWKRAPNLFGEGQASLMQRETTTTRSRRRPIKVGDRVKVLFGARRVPAVVIEDHGNIG